MGTTPFRLYPSTLYVTSAPVMRHRTDRVPFIVAGSAGGYLRTGQYLDLGGRQHNRLLSTLLNAALGRPKDRLIENFGDPALAPGVVREMLA
jgi:hypothetical protein